MHICFDRCLAEVLRHEGGWSDHPRDPGGATMKGITLATFRKWRPGASKEDLRNISDAQVAAIYKADYWDKVRADDLPPGLDHVTFDPAVNSGPSRGAKWLQSALGVRADGEVGPKTIDAARKSDSLAVIRDACRARLGFLRGLKIWTSFGRGWSRRVAEVEALSLALAMGGSVSRRGELQSTARKADTQARQETAKAGGAAAGGGGVTQAPDLPDWAMMAIGAALLVAVVLFIGNRIIERQRAKALRDAAERV